MTRNRRTKGGLVLRGGWRFLPPSCGSRQVLAIYTACLWGATKRLAKDAKDTSDRQSREMQESLRIATESANAAKLTVQTMDDTAQRQLRAYISITGGEMVEKIEGSNIFGFKVTFKNAGQTPAMTLSPGRNASSWTCRAPRRSHLLFRLQNDLGPHSGLALGPHCSPQ